MDMKVHGLPVSVLSEAIKKAHDGRMFIMKHMLSVLPGPRDHLSPYAPRIEKLKINPDKIGTVIGKGGETINKITAETGAEINISEDGLITISAVNTEAIDKALEWVKSLVEEPEVGKIYKGKVVSIKDFGAFVNILPGIDGMLHISQISDKRLDKVTDVLNVGDEVKVRLDAIDDKGRLSLSMKRVEQDK
jgi:polyribonucleotide nucleotidyltransferase